LLPVAVAGAEPVFVGQVVIALDLIETLWQIANVLKLVVVGTATDAPVEEVGLREDTQHGLSKGVQAVGGDYVAGERKLRVRVANDDERIVLIDGLGEVPLALQRGGHGGLLEALGSRASHCSWA